MSCKNCNDIQDGKWTEEDLGNGSVVRTKDHAKAYFRWKNANIEMVGCDIHLREIFDALSKVQKNA